MNRDRTITAILRAKKTLRARPHIKNYPRCDQPLLDGLSDDTLAEILRIHRKDIRSGYGNRPHGGRTPQGETS